ncbi:MAG: M1 family aminopeptidase [Saprospiraceae bacterium]
MNSSLPKYLMILLTFMLPTVSQAQEEEPIESRFCHHARFDVNHQHQDQEAFFAGIRAANSRSDSFDIVHTNINLEVINFSGQRIDGYTEIDFSPREPDLTAIPLDLEALEIDSVLFNGQLTTYNYDDLVINVDFLEDVAITDTVSVRIYYGGTPTIDPSGFGGFRFENGYAYNLGIGLASNPYNNGRSWFPCFDNFVERSTYEIHLTTANGRKGYAIGTFLGEMPMGGDTIRRSYEMIQPLPTYLVGAAVSTYTEYTSTHQGIAEELPILLVAKDEDIDDMVESFEDLGAAVDALESWFGPYAWETVGYVTTTAGAMEHPTLIAYPEFRSVGGNVRAQRDLMSHELAHCWWGNMTTLSTPSDMWFKEGNAEYGSYLFAEYLEGHDEFIRTVKSNFLSIITSAHIEDGGYHPLSGIPFEQTYSTHTYDKGAAMIHNLRTYLGDDLFRSSMTDVLNHFQYQSVNAAQFRDRLTETSGIDLTSFFDDWIYTPGFAGFEINEMDITPNTLSPVVIEQKLRAKTQLHTNVPLEITFLAADGSKHTEQIMVSNQLTEVQVNVPFEPVSAWLNENHKLNIANFASDHTYTEPDNNQFDYTNLNINVVELEGGDAYLRVEHAWIAPDEPMNAPDGARISNSHYWKIDGNIPPVFDAQANFRYNGSQDPKLDADLTEFTEDSLVLVYRASPTDEWALFEPVVYNNSSPTDKMGTIQARELRLGEYAFANGEFPMMVDTDEPEVLSDFSIFPNPGKGLFHLSGQLTAQTQLTCKVYDSKGQLMKSTELGSFIGQWNSKIDLTGFARGSYMIQVEDTAGATMATEQVVIQ